MKAVNNRNLTFRRIVSGEVFEITGGVKSWWCEKLDVKADLKLKVFLLGVGNGIIEINIRKLMKNWNEIGSEHKLVGCCLCREEAFFLV